MIYTFNALRNLLNTIILAWINSTLGIVSFLPFSSDLPSPKIVSSPQYIKHYISAKPQSNVESYVRQFTIEVTGDEIAGSGVIISKTGFNYTVLTCHHVLNQQQTVQLKTYDGQIYQAHLVPYPKFKDYDLALLQFTSLKNYPIATFGLPNSTKALEPIFVAGFPSFVDTQDKRDPFRFVLGRLILVSDKTLDTGYKIGYDNRTYPGMSGGPVVNARGQVIAIHGLGAYPLWSNPYIYEDRSRPCTPLWQIMYRLNWGIPTEHLMKAGLSLALDSTQLAQQVRPIRFSPEDPIYLQQIHQIVQEATACQDWLPHLQP